MLNSYRHAKNIYFYNVEVFIWRNTSFRTIFVAAPVQVTAINSVNEYWGHCLVQNWSERILNCVLRLEYIESAVKDTIHLRLLLNTINQQ
jgi:hypothetical protein